MFFDKFLKIDDPNLFKEGGSGTGNDVHIFDGTLSDANTKIDLGPLLRDEIKRRVPGYGPYALHEKPNM